CTTSAARSAKAFCSPVRCPARTSPRSSQAGRNGPTPPSTRRAMQHSHEALDRPGGFERARLLAPLRHRDFRVLWSGMAVSLVGDGLFLIAIAWEAYVLWNAPAALSIVGIGMTVPTVVFLLVGGVLSDRHDRRLLMLWADIVRAVAVTCLAVLVFAHALQLWQLVALVALYGCRTVVFPPRVVARHPDVTH